MAASNQGKKSLSKYFRINGASTNLTEEGEKFGFESWQPTDEIVITNNLNEPLKTIADPAVIQAVLEYIRQQQGWTVPEEGVPVARIRFNFYQGDRILGNLGLGATFLSTHHSGSFYSRPSTKAVRDHLFELTGLELSAKS